MKKIRVYVIKRKNEKHLRFKYCDHTGKWHYPSSGETRRREAERKAIELEETLNQPGGPSDGTLYWESFVLDYLAEHGPTLKVSSVKKVSTAFAHVDTYLKIQTVNDLTRQQIDHLVNALRQKGTKDTSIASVLRSLKAALKWGQKTKRIPLIPEFPSIKPRKGFRGRSEPLTELQFTKLLVAVKYVVEPHQVEPLRCLLRGLWLSGLRLNEAIHLSWDDSSPVAIVTSKQRLQIRFSQGWDKSGIDRVCPITRDFAEFLQCIRTDNSTVFPIPGNRLEKVIRHDTTSKLISRIGRASKVTLNNGSTPTAHDLRRSFAARWALRVAPKVLQELMRHSSIEMTNQYYAHLDADRIQDFLWNLDT